jgi:hypothetical protein
VRAEVTAYVCSHILAFDVQVHHGVLQLCTAGAGTAHRMPDGVEYLHCVQAALDADGLRYQVLDTKGVVRERLTWPLPAFHDNGWKTLLRGSNAAPFSGVPEAGTVIALRFVGRTPSQATAAAQTLLCAPRPGMIEPLWLGLRGPRQTLTLILGREAGRSPNYWIGPDLLADNDFALEVAFCPDMGPGGVLWRQQGATRWTSFVATSATGLERFSWPATWSIGQGQSGPGDRPYAGRRLDVAVAVVQ